MKKESVQKFLLILLPVVAVVFAATPNSVTVTQPPMSIITYGSYFQLMPEAGNCRILPPAAAGLAVISAILAVMYVTLNRKGCIKLLRWTAALSAVAAAAPPDMQETVLVQPHVAVPLLMAGLFLLCFPFERKENQKKEAGGRRLGTH